MTTSTHMSTEQQLTKLKAILQDLGAKDFERLVAALIGDLLGVSIAIAASGFQHGGDAGPGGRQRRRFRIETKRYSDTTSLSDRELIGEVVHALGRDEALEGWFLAATREVPEQLENDLHAQGESLGIPVVVIDWKADAVVPSLAALCTHAPDTVRQFAGEVAADLSKQLKPQAQASLESLKRDMQAWQLGFESLRAASHKHLEKLWKSPREARGAFGQDTASAAYDSTIPRSTIASALDSWWQRPAPDGSPALVLGNEGTGKTWATIDWLASRRGDLPVVLAVPSTAIATTEEISVTALKQMIADRIYEFTGVRSAGHWKERLSRLLRRPLDEGPVLVIFLDGLNQQPSANWVRMLQVLQMPELVGIVRVVISTRKFHFEDKLGNLKGLLDSPVKIQVDIYDDSPGGELDQRLQRASLGRDDLHPALIPFARVPRLFALVAEFKHKLVDAGKVTVHRLLWEYGRDRLGVRAGISFSEDEWREWLSRVAQDHLEGRRRYSVKTLSESTSRADLSQADVFRRLSELIDSPLLKKGTAGSFELTSTLVNHALGAALVSTVSEACSLGKGSVSEAVDGFLDPIAGLDERSEILRAAVSIAIEQDPGIPGDVIEVLVLSWLTSQNIPGEHQSELNRLAGGLVMPLLKVIEVTSRKQRAAELAAVTALRAIDRADLGALQAVIARATQWFLQVPRGADTESTRSTDADRARSDRLVSFIGVDQDGPHTVLGHRINLVSRWAHPSTFAVGALLEGFPLRSAIPLFEAIALHHALRGFNEMWDTAKWLVLLNGRDYHETAQALRLRSNEVQRRREEAGVSADIKKRVAALLLYMCGSEADDEKASALTPQDLYGPNVYRSMYLSDPGESFFTPEFRHAARILERSELPIVRRVEKCVEFFADPEFLPPTTFVEELVAHAREFDTAKLHSDRADPVSSYFQNLEVALARCAPEELSTLQRRWFSQLPDRQESRFISAVHSDHRFLLLDEASLEAARNFRLSATEPDENKEAAVANILLLLEIEALDPVAQYSAVIDAAPKFIYRDLKLVLKPLAAFEVDALLSRYAGDGTRQKRLLYLLSLCPHGLGGTAWDWVLQIARSTEAEGRQVAFDLLWAFDAERFGRILDVDGWRWAPSASDMVNHYGSLALIEATKGLPFEHVVERIAPWLVILAARVRGEEPADVRMAAAIIDGLLVRTPLAPPELGTHIIITDEAREKDPFGYSVLIEPEGSTPLEKLKEMSKPLEYEQRREHIVSTVRERIENARKDGAHLFLQTLAAEDFRAVMRHAPSLVDEWLEGMDGRTLEFRRRVHLADGAYLALCEALLVGGEVARGLHLWLALRAVLTSAFKGKASVDKLLLILMRAPASDETNAALTESLQLAQTNNDEELLDFVIGASMEGRNAWLTSTADADSTSGLPWRERRAQQFDALRTGNDLPLPAGWSHGEMDVRTRHRCAVERSHHIEACARYWYRKFWSEPSDDKAYAAWVLFSQTADRRTYAWLADLRPPKAFETHRRRAVHAALHEHSLRDAVEKREKKRRETFLNRKTSSGVFPWL